ncbi:MAG: VPA1262 family N-terminal domain-containing protein [Polyangiaceae bacterium]
MRGEHVQWLGDVLIAHERTRVVWWEPVTSEDGGSCRAFHVHVRPGTTTDTHVQVRATGLDGVCLCDRLVHWQPRETAPRRIDLEEQLQSVLIRAWSAGELVEEDHSCLLRGASFAIRMVDSSLALRDRLSDAVEGRVKAGIGTAKLLSQVRRVERSAMETTATQGMESESWAGLNNTAHDIFSLLPPRAPEHARFPVGAESRAQAVLHFADMVSKADQAYLVDPWFDIVGAQALLPRIRGGVALTVITNLATADSSAQRSMLRGWLASCRGIGLPENLQVACARSRRPTEQLFHDRFVLLRIAGRWRGFILTNSFSGLATKYSCFVVETPLSTTALLFEELQTLRNADLEEIWPPQRQPRQPANLREFPHCRAVLASLVPLSGLNQARLLRAAEARGFVVLRDGEVKWSMSPAVRERALEILIGAGQRSRRRLPYERGKNRRAVRHRRSCGSPSKKASFSVGRAVLAIGEMRARGLDVEADEVASRIGALQAAGIERELRRSFREDPDPTVLTANTRIERLRVRQSLALSVPEIAAAKIGHSMWQRCVWDAEGQESWGRCFAYAVLAHLAPDRAVKVAEDLLDADFVLSLRGGLHQRVHAWPDGLSAALLAAGSPLVRSLGIGAVLQDQASTDDSNHARFDCEKLLQFGATRAEVALHVAVWGMNAEESALPAAATALIAALQGVDGGGLDNVVEALFEEEIRTQRYLDAIVSASFEAPAHDAIAILTALIGRFARRFHELPKPHFSYSSVMAPLTSAMARAAAWVARGNGSSVADVIRSAARSDTLRSHMSPLTPYRYRQGTNSCDEGLGWVVIWELVAADAYRTFCQDNTPLEPAAENARDYLACTRLPDTSDARSAVLTILNDLEPNKVAP